MKLLTGYQDLILISSKSIPSYENSIIDHSADHTSVIKYPYEITEQILCRRKLIR